MVISPLSAVNVLVVAELAEPDPEAAADEAAAVAELPTGADVVEALEPADEQALTRANATAITLARRSD
jgi:hypothetical protein